MPPKTPRFILEKSPSPEKKTMDSGEPPSTEASQAEEEPEAPLSPLQGIIEDFQEYEQELPASKRQRTGEVGGEQDLCEDELEDCAPDEPSPDDPDGIRFDIQMPSGKWIRKRFFRSQSIKDLCEDEQEDCAPDEPSPDDPDGIRFDIRMPSGKWIRKRFFRSQSIKFLHFFVSKQDGAPTTFEIFRDFPRQLLPSEPTEECPEPPSFDDLDLKDTEEAIVFRLYDCGLSTARKVCALRFSATGSFQSSVGREEHIGMAQSAVSNTYEVTAARAARRKLVDFPPTPWLPRMRRRRRLRYSATSQAC
ncbi:hypothetical protein HPB50_015583 [Hyalomma asiaticum]|uniref:Uncharacterized protein n=1 Tax=Hyalomma asiaticum TaxID=266040 RepID=A0ACB7RWJ1_HYAAI|nr:hypothetical protein HPB50_015583 [Hyalomma asiaticum]